MEPGAQRGKRCGLGQSGSSSVRDPLLVMLKLRSVALTTLPHGFSVRTSLWEARAKRGCQEFRWPWCCHDNTLYLHRGEGASSQLFKGPFSCNNLGSSSLPMMTAEVSKSLNGSPSPVCVLSKFFFFSFEAVRKVEFVRSFHAVLKRAWPL